MAEDPSSPHFGLPSNVVGLKLSGWSIPQFDGIWCRCNRDHDGLPVFSAQNLGLYLHYRKTAKQWVIDGRLPPCHGQFTLQTHITDGIFDSGAVFSQSRSPVVHNAWYTSCVWATCPSLVVQLIDDCRGRLGEAVDVSGLPLISGHGDINGIYLRTEDFEGRAHYVCGKFHLIWRENNFTWQICPGVEVSDGAFARSDSPSLCGPWSVVPDDLEEQAKQIEVYTNAAQLQPLKTVAVEARTVSIGGPPQSHIRTLLNVSPNTRSRALVLASGCSVIALALSLAAAPHLFAPLALLILATVVLFTGSYVVFWPGSLLNFCNWHIKQQCRNGPFLNAGDTTLDIQAGLTALEKHTEEIQEELAMVLEDRERLPLFHHVIPGQDFISWDGKWRVFTLMVFGSPVAKNAARCPRTMSALSRVPGVQTAFFSILAPGTRIPPHCGPNAAVLRYHLGLRVPDDWANCFIVVGGRKYCWREGAGVLFDDTYSHHVWNGTDEERVVLFVDIDRPGLTSWAWLLQWVGHRVVHCHPAFRKVLNRAEIPQRITPGAKALSPRTEQPTL